MSVVPLRARQLAKNFGMFPVLRAIDFEVRRGECAVIVGRNGSGKSTLIKTLTGILPVSGGEVLLFGQPARALQSCHRRRIGVVTHQSFLYARLTARENLEFYGRLYGIDALASTVFQLLARVGLESVADERVSTFSRGMEQRLTLARALIANPDVLLMDEPFTALDVEGIDLALHLIGEAAARGCGAVITAHEDAHLGRLNSTTYALVNGRLASASALSDAQQAVEHSAAAS